jgi:hypothetical protein
MGTTYTFAHLPGNRLEGCHVQMGTAHSITGLAELGVEERAKGRGSHSC